MFNFRWLILRLAALYVFIGILIDIEIILLMSGFLLLHINFGLQAIISDYIHIKKIKFISSILVRISLIEMTRYFLELLV
uniref:Succinate:cytochrome c oxidoreductase subunit 4 n=1 Tax=Riquetophycus sp. HSY-2014a TaxID=1488470 RepID=A0A0E3DBK5_9FLOR|nr:succinate:cytochrome c oxidoreductase subunit 4 [Riquetophycus sp. HSY-2014a]